MEEYHLYRRIKEGRLGAECKSTRELVDKLISAPGDAIVYHKSYHTLHFNISLMSEMLWARDIKFEVNKINSSIILGTGHKIRFITRPEQTMGYVSDYHLLL